MKAERSDELPSYPVQRSLPSPTEKFIFFGYAASGSLRTILRVGTRTKKNAALVLWCTWCTHEAHASTLCSVVAFGMASSSANMSDVKTQQDPLDALLSELLSSSGGEGASRGRGVDDSGTPGQKPTPSRVGSRQAGRHVEDHDPWKALSDQVCRKLLCTMRFDDAVKRVTNSVKHDSPTRGAFMRQHQLPTFLYQTDPPFLHLLRGHRKRRFRKSMEMVHRLLGPDVDTRSQTRAVYIW